MSNAHLAVETRNGASGWGGTYLSLQDTDLNLIQGLASLVTVANVLKGLGGILAGAVEQNFFATTTMTLLARGSFVNGDMIWVSGRNNVFPNSAALVFGR